MNNCHCEKFNMLKENDFCKSFRISSKVNINNTKIISVVYVCMVPDINALINIYIDNENTFNITKKINNNKFKEENWKNIDNIQTKKLLYKVINNRKSNDNIKFNFVKVKAYFRIEKNEKTNKLAKESLNSNIII